MDFEISELDIQKLINLSISTPGTTSTDHEAVQNQGNTLIPIDMQFQVDMSHVQQFSQLYLSRLAKLAKRVPLQKIHSVQEVEARLGTISIVGVFKRIQMKRVRAFEKNFQEYYGNKTAIYNDKDSLQLQDQTGKIKFVLTKNATMNGKPIKSTDLPYGTVIGLTGKNNDEKMQFICQKVTLPALPPQKSLKNIKNTKNRRILIASSPSVAQLSEMLSQIFNPDILLNCFPITSILIIGFADKLTAHQYRVLDDLMQKYSDAIDIFIMPNSSLGEMYPQKPLHPFLFPKSNQSISLINNPQILYVNNDELGNQLQSQQIDVSKLHKQVLVCSGENIHDLRKNSSLSSQSLQCMQQLLEYSHLAPSSPFSLKCQMMKQDYLTINQLPHIFIAGDCEQTVNKIWKKQDKKVHLIAIKNRENIILNVDTDQIQNVHFCCAGAMQ